MLNFNILAKELSIMACLCHLQYNGVPMLNLTCYSVKMHTKFRAYSLGYASMLLCEKEIICIQLLFWFTKDVSILLITLCNNISYDNIVNLKLMQNFNMCYSICYIWHTK